MYMMQWDSMLCSFEIFWRCFSGEVMILVSDGGNTAVTLGAKGDRDSGQEEEAAKESEFQA